MARAGVTYHDVAKAAEAIKNLRQEPTVDRVREHLGTGSKSTIAPLLKRWRSDNGETADLGGLPNDLVEVVKSLHERVQQMADHRIEQARQEFKELNGELRKKLDDANNTIAQLNARHKDLEMQVGQLTDEVVQKTQALEDARIKLTKAELQRDEAVTRTTELKANVTELKQENRDIRDHFEHYQQRTAEDRQQEREQFRTTNQQMQDQLRELRGHLAQAEIRISDQTETNRRQQQSTEELEQISTGLSRELSEKARTIEKLDNELEVALSKSLEHQQQKDKLAEQFAAIELQKADADKEVALLSQSLETAKATLKATQDKVMLLTDENKVILQEKAVIQGQFKQLQSSL